MLTTLATVGTKPSLLHALKTMPLDFLEVEAALADPYMMEMFYKNELPSFPRVLQMEMGEFDHFEPLWRFLRVQGVKDLDYFRDFLILPPHIVTAHQQMNSLWPEIHRTRQFFHVDDDPFWEVRDLFGQLATSGSALLALCD